MSKDRLIEIKQLKDQLKKQDEKISETVEIIQTGISKGTEIKDSRGRWVLGTSTIIT